MLSCARQGHQSQEARPALASQPQTHVPLGLLSVPTPSDAELARSHPVQRPERTPSARLCRECVSASSSVSSFIVQLSPNECPRVRL